MERCLLGASNQQFLGYKGAQWRIQDFPDEGKVRQSHSWEQKAIIFVENCMKMKEIRPNMKEAYLYSRPLPQDPLNEVFFFQYKQWNFLIILDRGKLHNLQKMTSIT